MTLAAPDIPPFYTVDDRGALGGPIGELLQAIVEEAGFEIDVAFSPMARVVAAIARGEADVSILVDQPALRDAGALRSEDVVATDMLVSTWPADGPPARSIADMGGRTVALMHGYSYGGLANALAADGSVTIKTLADPIALVRYVDAGRADAAVMYESVLEEAILAAAPPRPRLKRATLWRIAGYLHLHPDAGGDGAATMRALTAAYRRLGAQGDPVLRRAGSPLAVQRASDAAPR